MPPVATGAIALSVALDAAVAEPPRRVHPVAWFGRAVGPFDRAWRRPRAVGALLALALPLSAAGFAGGATALGLAAGSVVGATVAGLVLFVTTSRRLLLDTARETADATETDLGWARRRLRALAGRDAAELSPAEIRSAAVESVAENLADGLVGPLLAFALLAPVSLSAAAGAAAWVKAVNTLDSMLGYRAKPVGWASARLDDAAMFVPARATAALLALAARDPGLLTRARRWAHAPRSPNAGWPMATLAAALDTRLGKPGVYVLNRGRSLPTAERARRGVGVVDRASLLAVLLSGGLAWL
jgi:adenosylcobinamide-phosphate synthase